MELPARLAEELSQLIAGVVDGTGLVDGLRTLGATLAEAVSGYAGMRLTLVHTGHPVRVTTLARRGDAEVVTSLGLSLSPVSAAFADGGRLVVWSTVAGSLVDLAADLGYVVRAAAPSDEVVDRVALDRDVPRVLPAPGVEGLAEWATIHRAVGLLIDQGHDPDTVVEVLRRDATAAGLSTPVFAARLLVPDPPGAAPADPDPDEKRPV